MPKPHKGPLIEYGPGAIKERPDTAIAFSAAVADWALIEDDVVRLYAFLMSRWSDQLPTISHMPAHPVGMLTFETLQTLNQRLSLLESLAKWALDTDQSKEIADTVPKIRTRAKERNQVAHGLWGVANDEPDSLVLFRRFKDDLVYTVRDFEDISDRIKTLHLDLNALMKRLIAHVDANGWREPKPRERPSGMLLG